MKTSPDNLGEGDSYSFVFSKKVYTLSHVAYSNFSLFFAICMKMLTRGDAIPFLIEHVRC